MSRVFTPPGIQETGLTAIYRGPDWAFAVAEGDVDALQWVLERCRFWNAASSLIIPVRRNGQTWPVIRHYLDVRPVERCFVHESVSSLAQAKVESSLDGVGSWSAVWDGFDDRELHPLLLQPVPDPGTAKPSLVVPRFTSARLRRISRAAWGHLPDEELPEYRGRYEIGEVDGSAAHAALLAGQLNARSPLEQSLRLIEAFGQMPIGRGIFVLATGSFRELVVFWNLRSRNRDIHSRPMVIGVTKESLEFPKTLSALSRFVADDAYYAQTPDLGITASGKYKAAAARALDELGFSELSTGTVKRSIGGGRGTEPLTYGFFGPVRGGPIDQMGAIIQTQVTINEGRISFQPPRPVGLPRTGHEIRVGFRGLPLPMPLTDAGAKRIIDNAYPSPEGLTILTNAWIGDGYLELRVPDAWESLEAWASSYGASVELSPPGRYGQAVLDRLSTVGAIDAVASEPAISILEALTPVSRKKLAQRVVSEARSKTDTEVDEELLAELLSAQSLFLELRARNVDEIAGQAATPKRLLLPALARLVEHGFVVRGSATRCPRCGIRAVLLLHEQEEEIRCRACRFRYLLPVLDESGAAERSHAYQLDGLMAAAMDQDLLPVLLTLRALRPRFEPTRAAWLGLEFRSGSEASEQDLLISNGEIVAVAECKATASISDAQLTNLIAFAKRHEAQPVVAALEGAFPAVVRSEVTKAGGLVLERSQLVE